MPRLRNASPSEHWNRSMARLLLKLFARRSYMLYYALLFLIVGLIAGALGVSGVAAMATQIAWVLFLIGVVLLVIHLLTGRSRPVI